MPGIACIPGRIMLGGGNSPCMDTGIDIIPIGRTGRWCCCRFWGGTRLSNGLRGCLSIKRGGKSSRGEGASCREEEVGVWDDLLHSKQVYSR